MILLRLRICSLSLNISVDPKSRHFICELLVKHLRLYLVLGAKQCMMQHKCHSFLACNCNLVVILMSSAPVVQVANVI